ncbi:hypothetical protein CHS0354_014197, partial [Potamilus streckersoni]
MGRRAGLLSFSLLVTTIAKQHLLGNVQPIFQQENQTALLQSSCTMGIENDKVSLPTRLNSLYISPSNADILNVNMGVIWAQYIPADKSDT